MACRCGGLNCDCTRNCCCDPFCCPCSECYHLRKGRSSRKYLPVHTRSPPRQSIARAWKTRKPEMSADELPQEEPLMFKMDDIDTSPESKGPPSATDGNNPRPKLTNPLYLHKTFATSTEAGLLSSTQPLRPATRSPSMLVHNRSKLASSSSTNVPSSPRESRTAAPRTEVVTPPSGTIDTLLKTEKPSSRGKSCPCSESSRTEKLKDILGPNNVPAVPNGAGNLTSDLLSRSTGSDSSIEVIPEDVGNLDYTPRNVNLPDISDVSFSSQVSDLQNPGTLSSDSVAAAARNFDLSHSSSVTAIPACSESISSENLRSSSSTGQIGTEPPSCEHSSASPPAESGNFEGRTDKETERRSE